MQLNLLGFLTYKIKTQMTKHKILFQLRQFLYVLELVTQSICCRFRQTWYQSLSLSFHFPTSHKIYWFILFSYQAMTFKLVNFFRTPGTFGGTHVGRQLNAKKANFQLRFNKNIKTALWLITTYSLIKTT